MAPQKKHTSHDQPRVKGKFVPKNPSHGGINDGSGPRATTSAMPSIPDISNLLLSGSHSSGKDVGQTATSELRSIKRDLPQSIDEASKEAQQDDAPPMSLFEVSKKWGRRLSSLRPRDDGGKVIRPPPPPKTEDIIKKLANISLGAADSHGAESGSDGSSDEDGDEDDEDESSTDEARETEGYAVQASETEGDAVQATEDDALEMADDVLGSDKLCQIEELNEARKTVKTMSKMRQVLAKYRVEHPEIKHVEAFSFSKLTGKHLDRLGVKRLGNAKFAFGDFHQQIEEPFNWKLKQFHSTPLSETFSPFWDTLTRNTDFLSLFGVILDTVGERPEARARLLTDHIILRVMVFLKQQLSLIPLLFLELILSAVTDPKPVVILHEEQATFLTGSVDYAIISSISTADKLRQTEFQSRVGTLIKESVLGDMLKDNDDLAAEFKDMNQFKFTIIEEKRKDHTGSKLEQCEPQVIGEGLAIIEKTGRNYVPWCISNGEEWLFGLLANGPKGKVSCRLPILSLNAGSREEGLKTLFKLLIIWTAIPDRVIGALFFPESEKLV